MLRVTSGIAHTREDSASPAECALVMVTVRAGRYGGSPGHPTGASPVGLPPGPNSLFKRGVKRLLREPLAGTTVQTTPGTSGHLPASFSQFKCMNQRAELGAILTSFRLTSEGPQVRTLLRPQGVSSKRRCLTCGNAVGHRLLLSGWLRPFTADGGWLRPIRAQVGRPRRHRCHQRPLAGWPDRRRVPAVHCRIEPFLYQGGSAAPGTARGGLRPWGADPPQRAGHPASIH